MDNRIREINIDPSLLAKIIGGVIVLVLAIIFFSTSWYIIEPEERGVVRRLGKYSRTVEPGLHFKWPFRIEIVDKVPVMNQLKQEYGFRTTQAGTRSQFAKDDYTTESLMLTGDLNVADVEWVTQYRINNPRDYLFKVRNLTDTFRHMNEAVMREIVGDQTINEVLTTGRDDIEFQVRAKLQDLCNRYEMGVTIDGVILQDVNPPDPVKPAFNEVNEAQQEKEKLINQARQEYNKVIPKATGEAAKTIEEAEGYAVERVNRARGEAERFNSVFAEYSKAPEVTRQRIYLETMADVLGKVGRKIITDDNSSGVLQLLNLNETLTK